MRQKTVTLERKKSMLEQAIAAAEEWAEMLLEGELDDTEVFVSEGSPQRLIVRCMNVIGDEVYIRVNIHPTDYIPKVTMWIIEEE